MNTIRAVLAVIVIPVLSFSANAATIVVPDAIKNDEGLKMAIDALQSAMPDTKLAQADGNTSLPDGDVILLGGHPLLDNPWKPTGPEAYKIHPVELNGRRALAVEGEGAGLMHGVFKLAELIRLGHDAWKIELERAPAFPLRVFSEEGIFLDLPDVAYYSDTAPYVNEELLRDHVEKMKRLADHVAEMGYNTLCILHVNFEEYIDYKYLDREIYPAHDRHRQRSPIFCKYLTELADHVHARHMKLYLQPYEFQFPPKLAKLYGLDINSKSMERVINAKVKELFERVPLDGLIITATETHPRCGYGASQIWRSGGQRAAGRMATLYHEAAKKAGRHAVLRLWRVAGDEKGAREVSRHSTPEAMLAIKCTGADYFLNWPTTDAITSGLPKQRPMMVLFDTFREYDGWSRLFIFMKRWEDTIRACRDNGVQSINAWGPWSPGCIWDDQGGKVSWIGHWETFRTFLNGFTPGQANVYLLGRLSWNPDEQAADIAHDFATLHLGRANASAGAEALLASEDAFAAEYLGEKHEIVHPCYLKWTMVFAPRGGMMEEAYGKIPLRGLIKLTRPSLEAVARMEASFARTDPTKAPDAERYRRFREGIEKTALYLRTFYAWREGWWRGRADRDLTGEAKLANRRELEKLKVRLTEYFNQWKRWPEEAGHWRITYRYGKPDLPPPSAFPNWWGRANEFTMENTAAKF